MKPADKQAYLEEYELLKKKGKPFFPYAILKDSAMALIVVVVIAFLSIMLGAEQGPKVDPTTTTYVPRPEWYFFFLFELLRVLKPPELVPLATIGIPTICMVLLLLLPGAIIALIGAHLYLVVKLGTTAPPWVRAERPKSAAPVSQLDAGESDGAPPRR